MIELEYDFTLKVAGHKFGFIDSEFIGVGANWTQTRAELGPLGGFRVPFSANVGWGIVILTPIVLVLLIAALTRRRKKFS